MSIGGFEVPLQSNAFRLDNNGQNLLNYWWANDLSVAAPSMTVDTWFLATVTCNGTTRKIYYNDTLLGTDTQSGHNVQSTEIHVGATWLGGGETLQGNIAMARIYNRELTAEEVASVFSEFSYRYQ